MRIVCQEVKPPIRAWSHIVLQLARTACGRLRACDPYSPLKTILQDVGDELLVLDRETNRLHHLNPTASWIYRRCDGRNSVETLVDALIEQFAIERETVERDLLQTLAQLRTLGLITRGRLARTVQSEARWNCC